MPAALQRLDLRLDLDAWRDSVAVALFRPTAADPATRFYALQARWCVAVPRADEHAALLRLVRRLPELGIGASGMPTFVERGQRLAIRQPATARRRRFPPGRSSCRAPITWSSRPPPPGRRRSTTFRRTFSSGCWRSRTSSRSRPRPPGCGRPTAGFSRSFRDTRRGRGSAPSIRASPLSAQPRLQRSPAFSAVRPRPPGECARGPAGGAARPRPPGRGPRAARSRPRPRCRGNSAAARRPR